MRILLWAGMAALPFQAITQPVLSEKKLLLSLGAGETLLAEKSCFLPGTQGDGTILLTRDTSGYHVYIDGKKSWFYKEEAQIGQKGCDSNLRQSCANARFSNPAKESLMAKYIGTDARAAAIIRHKGISYGPYQAIMQFEMSEDESIFAAIVMEQDASIRMVHSSGKRLLLQGIPYFLLLSPDGSQALAGLGKSIEVSGQEMTRQEIEALMSYEVFDLAGKRYGPFRQDVVDFGHIWFCKTGGPHWYMLNGEEVFRNGKALRKAWGGLDPCGLWFHPDGKRLAAVYRDQAPVPESPDTWFIHDPLLINGRLEAGKVVLDWISLENEKDLLLHRMSF